MITAAACRELDAADPLISTRERFDLADGLVYLDGNSLGPPVKAVSSLLAKTAEEWRDLLINGWWGAAWIDFPRRIGDLLAPILGAADGSVVCTDSTSVNLYKALVAATDLTAGDILTDTGNFPSDLYLVASVAERTRRRLRIVEPDQVLDSMAPGVLALTQVDFRTGRQHDLGSLTAAAHATGAITVWDLSHSAGVMPIDLDRHQADLAVGCTYKFLNGGPGAPAFIYARPDLQISNPINGWFSHEAPFNFDSVYKPAPGIDRMRTGSPHIFSMAVLEAALGAFDGVDLKLVRSKSEKLTAVFIELVDDLGEVLTPTDPAGRGSQVSIRVAGAEQLIAALTRQGIVADYRPPDVARFGFAPLFVRYADVWTAASAIRDWRQRSTAR